jgi:hypothetical protein
VAAKNITDITDPTPAPPRKGRVQEGMAAHKSFLQRVNCYIIAIVFLVFIGFYWFFLKSA